MLRRLVCIAVIACGGMGLRAQTPPASADLVRQAEQRIKELQAEADRLAAQTGTLLGELRKLELQREIQARTLDKAQAELSAVTAERDASAARLAALEAERVAATPGVQERLVEIYKRGRGGYIRLLLAAEDLQALGRMSRGVAAVARLDRLRLEQHRRTIRAERQEMAELEKRRAQVAAAEAEAAKARRALDAAVAAQNRRLNELDARRDLAARYVGELKAAASALQQRMAGMSSEAPAALPLAPFRGALEWPVSGRIVSRFGRGSGRFGAAVVRNGVEIAAAAGTEVRAVHGGVVSFAAPFVGYGTLVILDHGDNNFTLYGHLQEATVAPGTRLERGSVLGRAGRNPEGTEVVYFEVRIDGRPVDPVQWLRRSS